MKNLKTPEDEAFEDIERRQGGFHAKRQAAMDKVNAEFDEEYIKYRTAFPKGYIAPQQEPADKLCHSTEARWCENFVEVKHPHIENEIVRFYFTQPMQRPWVGLTDEDRKAALLTAYKEWECEEFLLCAREDYLLIEQALKEKNNG